MFQGIFFLHSLRAVLFSETSAGGARAANGLGGGGGRHGAALATIALAPTLQKIRDLGVIHTFEVRVEPRKTLAHARTWQVRVDLNTQEHHVEFTIIFMITMN